MTTRLCAAVLALLALPAPAYARPGDLDRSFGTGGTAVYDQVRDGRSLAVLPDGRVRIGSQSRLLGLTRFGRPDPAFGPRGLRETAYTPSGVELSRRHVGENGSALVVVARDRSLVLRRLLPTGELDRSFGTGGESEVAPIDLQLGWIAFVDGRGRAVVAGQDTDLRSVLLRVTADGALDRSFGQGGVRRGGRVILVAEARRDGLLLATRPLKRNGRHGPITFHTLDARGRDPRRFGPGGGYERLDAMHADARGRLVLRGRLVGREGHRITRLRRDGGLDRSFGSGGHVLTRELRLPGLPMSSSLDRRGRLLLVGQVADRRRPAVVARLRPDGRVDRGFGRRGVARAPLGGRRAARIGDVEAGFVIALRDGALLLTGAVYEPDNTAYMVLTRLDG